MKAIKTSLLCLFLFAFISKPLAAQMASYAEAGFMQARMKTKGNYETTRLPGFSIAVSGLEVSLFAGQFRQTAFPDSAKLGVNGGFWNIGYIWRSKPKANLRRFHYTIGGGMGSYGLGESNGFQLNVHPGIQVNLSHALSLAVSCYAGRNMFDRDIQEGHLLYQDDFYKSSKGFFILPTVTLRMNTNPQSVIGEHLSRSEHWGGGMVEQQTTTQEGDFKVTRTYKMYLPAMDYVSGAITTSTNYLNVFPKIIVGSRHNDRAPTIAGGGGIAFRLGIIAVDVEHLEGKVGFSDIANGRSSNQDYWKMRRTTVGLGINLFSIPYPFEGPSLVRLIVGTRIGKANLESNRPTPAYVQGGTDPHPENMIKERFIGPFWAVEFGTLGVHFERINNKKGGFGSGTLVAATYLVPISGKKK